MISLGFTEEKDVCVLDVELLNLFLFLTIVGEACVKATEAGLCPGGSGGVWRWHLAFLV